MELRHLRYFTAVAEELHFGRAAARLHMAQPPLSQHILNLEKEIGVKLFERTKRKVELTAAGRALLDEARLILTHAERAVRTAQRAARGKIGRLAVGFVMSATCSVLPEILQVFRARFPAVELVLQETTTGEGIAALQEGRMHLCFLRLPVNSGGPGGTDKELKTETVLRERIILALPGNHRLAGQTKVSLRALSGEPFVIFPRNQGSGFYDQIVSLCHGAGFNPRVVQEATQMQTILSLVAAGIGIALIPATVQSLRGEGVIYKPLREQTPATGIAIVWRKDDSATVLENFLTIVREVTQPERSYPTSRQSL
ncbi:MAG: LysR family transcriptional regulator [Blastocatellia bacterium]